ncbi:MAG TPA: arsenite methyltransferase [Bacteroidia bacterium]|nr:arsenite methyltransferase [Bacteroidia bacterium]
MQTETIKKEIKRSYGEIAKGNKSGGCCNNTTCCTSGSFSSMTVDYSTIEGYNKDADLSLGCGIPTEIADIKAGDTVIDLGSGAGNDVFIARKMVGEKGKVIGIDMTPEMVIRAYQNNQKAGYKNVGFILGEIENMREIADNTADVVISNCVMNLVSDKEKAFKEVHRVLKTNGHFSISDIVFSGHLPEGVFEAAEMYAGCVAGASEKGKYLDIIKSIGFKNIQIKKERLIELPDELLLKYINKDELNKFKQSGSGVYSITVYAEKSNEGKCCEANSNECCGSHSAANTEESACCGNEANNTKIGCCD